MQIMTPRLPPAAHPHPRAGGRGDGRRAAGARGCAGPCRVVGELGLSSARSAPGDELKQVK